MTEQWKLDHRDKKKIRDVKKKARPGKKKMELAIYNLDLINIILYSSFFISYLNAALNDRA